MTRKDLGTHDCRITAMSKYTLQVISPLRTGGRFWRKVQVLRYPISSHPEGKVMYRSENLMAAERYRLVVYSPVIIHPYSWINVALVFTITHIWILSLFNRTYFVSFPDSVYRQISVKYLYPLMKTFHALYQFLRFLIGYRNGNYIVLDFGKIARRYLLTYFIIDFIDWFPFHDICKLTAWEGCEYTKYRLLFLVFRTPVFLEYLQTVLWVYGVPRKFRSVTRMLVVFLLALHILTCITNNVPHWLYEEKYRNVTVAFYKKATYKRYLICMHRVLGHCYAATCGKFGPKNPIEAFLYIIILGFGFLYRMYFTTAVVTQFGRTKMAKRQYQENLKELEHYLVRNKFPPSLRDKVVMHYKHKHNHRYYKSKAINSNLSEHLRYELMLHSRSYIIQKCKLFKGLPISLVGQILATLIPELYLPNETVFKGNEDADSLFLISHGTVAIYSANGNEIDHLDDGSVLGTIGYYQITNAFSAISIEFTEIYRWEYRDITAILKKSKELTKRLEKLAQIQNRGLREFKLNDLQILRNLRAGRILERPVFIHEEEDKT